MTHTMFKTHLRQLARFLIERQRPSSNGFGSVRSTLIRTALLCVAAITATPTQAAEDAQTPETLLSADSVIYYRFDGMQAHQDAYGRTILAQLLRNEFGPLIDDLSGRILDAVGPQALSERLLAGVDPDQLIKVQSATKQVPHLLDYLWAHGFVLGVEVIDPQAPRFQVTVVFPDGGTKENRSLVYSGFRIAGLISETEVEEVQSGDLKLLQMATPDPVHIRCLQQGRHMVLTIGTEVIEHTTDLTADKRPGLTSQPLYQKMAEFRHYETFQRGFLDFGKVFQLIEKNVPPAAQVIDRLGLRGLHNVHFQSGFQEQFLRGTIVFDVAEKREGLLRLFGSGTALDVEGLPPIPPDAVSMIATQFDPSMTYQTILEAIQVVGGLVDPEGLQEFQEELETFESALGINLQQDLFAALGSTFMLYNSPSEGPLSLGMGLVFKVKNASKLTRSLETLFNELPSVIGTELTVRKRVYGGMALHIVEVPEEGFPFAPSYAVSNGWMVFSLYPQTVQGFIDRSNGDFPVWKLPEVANTALEDVKRSDPAAKITTLSVIDPRPTIVQILSFSPFVVKLITNLSGMGNDFDVSLIPNALTVRKRLTHNVSVGIDQGTSIRVESYSSFPMPLQLSGLEPYIYLSAFSALSFAF